MSNLFTTGYCYLISEITTNPPEMTIESEIWDIIFVEYNLLMYIIIFNISGNRVKFVSFLSGWLGPILALCRS